MKTFKEFTKEVEKLISKAAAEKGYNRTGLDSGENELYSFIQNLSESDSHAIGEIIYKAVRYSNKKDKKDILKIAAWAYLIWKFGIENA